LSERNFQSFYSASFIICKWLKNNILWDACSEHLIMVEDWIWRAALEQCSDSVKSPNLPIWHCMSPCTHVLNHVWVLVGGLWWKDYCSVDWSEFTKVCRWSKCFTTFLCD
jgi:hypothetical protein